jgi:hypothetical protein
VAQRVRGRKHEADLAQAGARGPLKAACFVKRVVSPEALVINFPAVDDTLLQKLDVPIPLKDPR